MVSGDFNTIFNAKDKSTNNINWENIHRVNAFIHELSLQEPTAVGRRFTWTNGQDNPIWVKLDRFMVNNEWLACFPRVIQVSLSCLGFDHVLI